MCSTVPPIADGDGGVTVADDVVVDADDDAAVVVVVVAALVDAADVGDDANDNDSNGYYCWP